jgi:transketolase N-terminal domain/subunit
MSKGTARRAVRIEGDLWEAAKQAAAKNGDNLSAIIREALSAYVRDMGNPNEHQ